jgi:hypothetical protein
LFRSNLPRSPGWPGLRQLIFIQSCQPAKQ